MPVPTTNISFSTLKSETEGVAPGLASPGEFSLSNGTFRSLLVSGPGATPGTAVSAGSANGAVFQTFTISTNTASYNIYNALVATGWSGSSPPGVKFKANVNITSPSPTIQTVVYAADTTTAALRTGSLPSFANLLIQTLHTNTFVVGMGGAGGGGATAVGPAASENGSPGSPGGNAIFVEAGFANIVNQGHIGGGGGGGGGGGNYTAPAPCLAADSQVLMYDGTTKNICDIIPGDKLKTLTGEIGTVLYLNPTTLKRHRKIVRLKINENAKPLRITDDHDLWIKDENRERFGVYNYNCWLQDEIDMPSYKSGDPIDMKILSPLGIHNFATVDGWTETSCEWEINSNPEEPVYCIMLDKGVGFIADGFVVANDDWYDEELVGVSWKGV
jgi:hypothetical protein